MNFVYFFMSQFRYWLDCLLLRWVPPSLPAMQLGPEGSSQNPTMIQFFTWDAHHPDISWWEHFEKQVLPLVALGFTQVWLPPPHKAMVPKGCGYDAYDLWDLGEFDQKGTVATRWGTKEELLRACDAAKQCNLNIIIDAVLNHKLGADRTETFRAVRVDPLNRLKDIGSERHVKGWTAFDFPGRLGKVNSTLYFDWLEVNVQASIVACDGISIILLTGMSLREPMVYFAFHQKDMKVGQNGLTIVIQKYETIYLHGARGFLNENSLQLLIPYVRAFQGQTSFFDVPLHENFHRASKTGVSYDLRTILDGSLVKLRPGDAVTFVDNHDTLQQVGQSLESWVGINFKSQAYALILLRCHGYPCVFYGDLYPNDECYDEDTSRTLKQLLLARKSFAYGPMVDYFEHRNCIGFVRMGDSDHAGCAVVLSNDPMLDLTACKIRMNVGSHPGTTFRSFFDGSRTIAIDHDGWGAFPSSVDGVEVWIENREIK
ncbi:hypothetical protein AZE42_03391 [Rhizopogon vesiculosus]|uniref:Glycosyl hydrolase family 13 catalytic domain-containing protein n=1 Tax=Rhizopogon vesiculosus TaxID=180088 RepID=A0A1J8PVB4_9AGAM|nr:hypothetical protein AZE42_03391 [Rhizopogon vesiculosus]